MLITICAYMSNPEIKYVYEYICKCMFLFATAYKHIIIFVFFIEFCYGFGVTGCMLLS